MDLHLAGRTALVSGATRGIGAAIAKALAGEGVDLFLTARSADDLARTAEQLATHSGVQICWASVDYTQPGVGDRVAREALEAYPRIDILINNAGNSRRGSLHTTGAEWADSYQLNFLSHLETMRTLLPTMRERGWGRVVNIVGTAYRHPVEFSTGTIAKYGLLNASQVTAREIASDGVTINAITVGLIETPQITGMIEANPALRKRVIDDIPMGRLGVAEDIANAALFLCSDLASYITASSITIDGGAETSLI